MLLGGAVEREAGVVLLGDLGRLLDPEHLDGVALDVHAEDVRRVPAALISVGGELDAAGLPAPAHLHLRLHHDRVADPIGRGNGVVDVRHGCAR